MEPTLATLELNGNILVENIPVFLDGPAPDHTGVLTTWGGSFELPADLGTEKQVELYNNYRNGCRLIFNDGRAGKILITWLRLSLPCRVAFQGTGNLS